MSIKSMLFVSLLIIAAIYLAGCKKSTSEIVGDWVATGENINYHLNGTLLFDTTFTVPPTVSQLNLHSNGRYAQYAYGNLFDTGSYTYSNTAITFTNQYNPAAIKAGGVTHIDGHHLSISFTSQSGDTIRQGTTAYTR